ncbi:MAG: hypothetical protein HY842_13480 [Bacteroidetes bacterium]|nr:hypothetical protein [Bacteroidota bacterium]
MEGKIKFNTQEGGMSVWAEFDPPLPLPEVAAAAKKKGLVISTGLINDRAGDRKWNAAHLGFAVVNEEEIKWAIDISQEVTH